MSHTTFWSSYLLGQNNVFFKPMPDIHPGQKKIKGNPFISRARHLLTHPRMAALCETEPASRVPQLPQIFAQGGSAATSYPERFPFFKTSGVSFVKFTVRRNMLTTDVKILTLTGVNV